MLYLGGMVTKTLSPDKEALADAVRIVGGQTALAEMLSAALDRPVSQQWVSAVINRDQAVPAEWCLPLEEATKRKKRRYHFRPDLYPAPVRAEVRA